MKRALINIGKKIICLFLCAVIFAVTSGLALSIAFPIGGGHFHSIFAYTNEGRLEPALMAYTWEVGVLTLTAMLLLLLRYPLSWVTIALVGSVMGLWNWWLVCFWTPQSPHFHKVALLLPPLIPAVIFYACAAMTWLQLVVRLRGSQAAAAP